jgi:hypothetical protein
MLTRRDHKSGDLFDPWEYLGPQRRRLLEQSWAGVFRKHLLNCLPVGKLESHFCRTFGRPSKDAYVVLGGLILQQLHNLTDSATVEAVALHVGWHYALDIRSEADAYICERTLRNYRRLIIENNLEGVLFHGLTDELIRAFGIDTSRQRIDSTAIRSDMRTLTRLGIFVETISKFLRELARKHPQLHCQVDVETLRLYVDREGDGCFALTKPSESKRRLPEAAETLYRLVETFRTTAAAELESYRLLTRVLAEQCDVVIAPGQESRVQIKEPGTISCTSLQNPADPDASYNTHRGQGYMAQIMESYVEDDERATGGNVPSQPDLITHVAVHDMTKQDWQAVEPALDDLSSRAMTPKIMLGDTHYGSEEDIQTAEMHNVELIAPATPPKGSKQGRLTLEQFELDKEGLVVRCPEGHAPIARNAAPKKFEVRFDSATCDACFLCSQCPAYSTTKKTGKARWQYTKERVQTCGRRLGEKAAIFKERYRWRAGIEGTMSRLKRQMSMQRLRVRGMAAVSYTVFLRALGLNIWRMTAFLEAK